VRGGGGGRAEAADDARRFGFPAELIAAIEQTGVQDECEVWAENWETVRAFAAISTQWRVVVGMGGAAYVGLDYAAARAGLELSGFEVTPALWDGIRVMESEALAWLNGQE